MTPRNAQPTSAASFLGVVLIAAVALAIAPAVARTKPLDWKAAEQALLRVDDHPVSEWNLYQANKKDNRFLLRMNERLLFVDVATHQIFELDPSKIEHKGDDLVWDPDDRPDKPLETSGWVVKDVGSGYRFSAHLVAENHVLDVQIPHPLDLRPIHPIGRY